MTTSRLFIVTIVIFSLLSCSKKGEAPPAINSLLDGTWRVTGFTYNNEDRTSDLSGYTFILTSDKKITAMKQDTSVMGTWHSDYTPREGDGIFDPGGELYIEFKFSSHAAAFLNISKRWQPYIAGNDATLLTFDPAVALSLIRN